MRKLLCTLALAALMAGAAATASASEGWYGRVDVGYSTDGQLEGDVDTDIVEDTEARLSQIGSSGRIDLDDGWMGDVGFGYAYGNGFRAEGELAYRTNDIPSVSPGLSSEDVTATSLMVNGLYDFNRDGRFQPFVGLGVGYAQVEAGSEDDGSWAWQAMAGIGTELTERLMLDIGYRFFRVEDLESAGASAEYEHQAVTVGLRYQFGAPAPAPVAYTPPPPPVTPPPPPPPPVCPQSDFVVYFEWDRSNLNDAALQVIDQAVARARQCNTSSVSVVGHTDTSGSNAYNAGLSERRAAVVRDAMVARGMGAALITTQARGESELARATGDGVREPLNRRTAVTIRFR